MEIVGATGIVLEPKTARQMFKALNYEVMELCGFFCIRKILKATPYGFVLRYGREMWFRKETKEYKVYNYITMEEHLAIHQLLIEMGWIDEPFKDVIVDGHVLKWGG